MRNFLIFLLITGGLFQPAFSQVDLPANQSLTSPAERFFIQQVSNGNMVDPFMMHSVVNHSIDTNAIHLFRKEVTLYMNKLTGRFDINTQAKHILKTVFYKVHQKYLKSYQPYATFGDLITEGRYDCLTGTILYAWILDELGFESEAIVTKHHTYLLINIAEGSLMFESTDALNGFIYQPEEIASRLAEIEEEESSDQALATGQLPVSFTELIGLQYYNAAVNAYNNMDFIQSVDQLEKGSVFYRGEMMKQFGAILARGIVASDLDRNLKTAYLMKLTQTLNGRGSDMASLN